MIKNFSVPNPCNENWNGMTPRDNGRYCSSCQKVVVDFTNKSKEEIIEYLNANAGKKICGTFKTSTLLPKKENSHTIKFLAALILSFGSALFGCSENNRLKSLALGDTIKNENLIIPEIITGVVISIPSYDTSAGSTHLYNTINYNDSIKKTNSLSKSVVNSEDSVHVFVDTMPEFPGGAQELYKYISKNFKYLQTTHYIGRLYVSFIVTKDGSISDIKNLKLSNTDYDQHIIELMQNMPKWSPGILNGKPVNVRFTLPINICFKE